MTNLKSLMEKLVSIRPEGSLVTSLYLHLRPQERQNRKYLTIYKDMVKEKKAELERRDLSKDALEGVEEDFKKIEEFLSDPDNLEGCRGIGVFSCAREGIFEVVKLPYVYRNRLMVAPTPLVREITAIEEEFGRVGILLVDRKHIRYFLMDIESITESVDFFEPLATRAHRFHSGGSGLKGAQGSFQVRLPQRGGGEGMVQHSFGEWRFHMRIREEWHRILKLASDAAFEDWKLSKFDKLVIGGFIEEGLREIENHLHSYLKERLVGYIEVNPSEAKPHEIKEKVLQLLWEKDREEERALLEEVENLKGKGLAVSGTEKVLEMLAIGNVRTLIIPEDYEERGYLCPKSHLAFLKPQCPLEDEEAIEVEDIVDEVIEEALEQRAQVEVIVEEELRKKMNGLSALLRFSL